MTLGHLHIVFSQTHFVFGKIIDSQKKSLFEVRVNFLGQEKFVLTDAQGNFKIDLPPEGSSMDFGFR
jgi:hypothetical protein